LLGRIVLVIPEEWDWSRTVVDHLDLHVGDFAESVRFYEAVLGPLGIPKLYERDGEACFTHVNVVERTPPTQNLHLCFYARSRSEVDAFHRRGRGPAFAPTALRATATTLPATTPRTFSTPTATTSRRFTGT
jgi:catechol 2,3-dioxygenase-like lactoylglutathione lyase family enzyme